LLNPLFLDHPHHVGRAAPMAFRSPLQRSRRRALTGRRVRFVTMPSLFEPKQSLRLSAVAIGGVSTVALA